MKFRRLRREELEEIEPQFVRFLAAQSIPAADWAKLKVTDETRSLQLIDQFSAMVFDDVINRCEYLEQRGPSQLLVYRSGNDKLELRGILVEGESDIDFTAPASPAEMAAKLQSSNAKLKLVAAERSYKPDRQADIFKLLEQGGRIANSSELFDLIAGLAPQNEEET